MQRWEYLLVAEPEISRELLNGLGMQGWELIGTGHGFLCFKRSLPDEVAV